jgi:hypothetical protein
VEALDVDIGVDVIPLRFCERQPRRCIPRDARIVDTVASFSERTVEENEREREREREI